MFFIEIIFQPILKKQMVQRFLSSTHAGRAALQHRVSRTRQVPTHPAADELGHRGCVALAAGTAQAVSQMIGPRPCF